MVRAALEEGLAHHTPETLRELVRTGVYKAPDSETDREEKKVPNKRKAAAIECLRKYVSKNLLAFR